MFTESYMYFHAFCLHENISSNFFSYTKVTSQIKNFTISLAAMHVAMIKSRTVAHNNSD
jgi:hypothetical protein